jgi:hypothetical protein
MRTQLLSLMTVLIFGEVVVGQAPAPAQAPQPEQAQQPRFEETLSKTVVRITGEAQGVDGTLNGTGFLVEVPEPRLPGNKSIVYLVTNRPVATAMTPDTTGRDVPPRVPKMDAIVNLKVPVTGNRAKSQASLVTD